MSSWPMEHLIFNKVRINPWIASRNSRIDPYDMISQEENMRISLNLSVIEDCPNQDWSNPLDCSCESILMWDGKPYSRPYLTINLCPSHKFDSKIGKMILLADLLSSMESHIKDSILARRAIEEGFVVETSS